MSEICAGLGAGTSHPQVRTFWNLAAGDVRGAAPRPARLRRLHQARRVAPARAVPAPLERGDSDVSERLARDLLFFCAQAAPAGRGVSVPRLDAVREAYGFAEQQPTDYAHSVLGRFDPAIVAHAKKRVVAAKEAWSATAGGEMHRLAGLSEQFALVGDSLRRLFPFGEAFADRAADGGRRRPSSRRPRRRRRWRWKSRPACSTSRPRSRTATSTSPSTPSASSASASGSRSCARSSRPSRSRPGWRSSTGASPTGRPWAASSRSCARRSPRSRRRSTSSSATRPTRPVLVDVPVQLGSMRGVLSVLGMDPASQALLRMRDEVDGLVSTEVDPAKVKAAGVFERLAGNLSALGFMIDMLSVQPHMAKSLFVYDAEAGTLAPVMGRSAAPSLGRAVAGRAAPDRAGADARLHLGARGRAGRGGLARPRAPVARGPGRRPAGARRRRAEGAGGDRQGRATPRPSPARAASSRRRSSTSSPPRPSRPGSRR